jgi:hypothetical protein
VVHLFKGWSDRLLEVNPTRTGATPSLVAAVGCAKPVVIVTGKNDLKEVDDLQPLHIVRKPFQADVLLELIETHCPRR